MAQQQVYRTNFLIELSTPTPRRLTSYRGYASNGQRGIIFGGNYYKTQIVAIPGIDEGDTIAPLQVDIVIGNAKNDYTDLYSNTANLRSLVKITKLTFDPATTWLEAIAPTVLTSKVWFEGILGKPALRGSRIVLTCHADMGRRGKSPKTKSRSLMSGFAPLREGQTIELTVRRT